jgi:hypothetical protein
MNLSRSEKVKVGLTIFFFVVILFGMALSGGGWIF